MQSKSPIVWTDVDSSNIRSVAYHDNTHTLCVLFANGGAYSYSNVEHGVYVDLVHAESVGQYLARSVKGLYPYTKYDNKEELEKGFG